MPETREARLNRIDSEGCSPEDVAWMIAELRGESREEWQVSYEWYSDLKRMWKRKPQSCFDQRRANEFARDLYGYDWARNVRIERRVVTVGEWKEVKNG